MAGAGRRIARRVDGAHAERSVAAGERDTARTPRSTTGGGIHPRGAAVRRNLDRLATTERAGVGAAHRLAGGVGDEVGGAAAGVGT